MAYKKDDIGSSGSSASSIQPSASSSGSSNGSVKASVSSRDGKSFIGKASSGGASGKVTRSTGSANISRAAQNARAAVNFGTSAVAVNKNAPFQMPSRPITGTFSQQGNPAKAGVYAKGGLNPSSWGSSMLSPSVKRDDPFLQQAIDDLSLPTDYADRNIHGINPSKDADESYSQEAAKWNFNRQVWAFNDTRQAFTREYANDQEKLDDILDLMSHAQVYYNDAKKNDYKFTINGEEKSAADEWKNLYDQLDRYSSWMTDVDQVQDLFSRYANGEDISMDNVEAMTARAQARLDNPYDNDDAAMWKTILGDLTGIGNGIWNKANRTDAKKLQEQIDAYTTQLDEINKTAANYETSQVWMDSADVFTSDKDREEINNRAAELKAERDGIYADQQAAQEQLNQLDSMYRERNMTPEIEQALAEQSMDDLHREKYYYDKAREELTRLDEEGRVSNAAISMRAREMQEQNQQLLNEWNAGLGFNPRFYNDWDKARAGVSAAAQQFVGGGLGAASWAVKATKDLNDRKNELLGRPTAAPERTAIGSIEEGRELSASLSTQIADLEAQKNALLNEGRSAGVDGDGKMFHSRTLSQSTNRLGNLKDIDKELAALHAQLGDIEFQMKQMNGEPTSIVDKLRYMTPEEIAASADAVVDTLDKNSAELISMAKEGTGDFGKFLIDVEVNGLQMLGDQAFGPASLVMLGTRVFGNGTAEKRREGYGLWKQGEAGLIDAGIEVLSESLFNVIGLYGNKSISKDLTERLVKEWADTPFGRTAMRSIISVAGEQGEEIFSWNFSPLVEIALGEKDWAALNPFNREKEDYEELVSAILSAGALAGLGSLNISGHRAANEQLFAEDVMEYGDRTNQYEQDIENANSTMSPFTDEQQSNFDRVRTLQNRIENTISGQRVLDEKGNTVNPEEAERQAVARGQQQQGYIARLEQSPFWQKIRANTQNIITRGKRAPTTEAQPVDNSDTIEQEATPNAEEQVKANAMAQSQQQALEGQENAPAPAPKKANSPTGQTWHQLPNVIEDSPNAAIQKSKDGSYTVHLNIDSSSGRFRVFDTLDGARAFFNSVNNANGMATSQAQTIEGQDVTPAPAPEKTNPATATETAQGEAQASTQAQTPANPAESVKPKQNAPEDTQAKIDRQEAKAKLDAENAGRYKADSDAIDEAWANREHSGGYTASFEGTFQGKNATITYDASKKTLTYTYEDGTSDTLTGINRRKAKKYVNEARSTLKTGAAQPAPAQIAPEDSAPEAEEASGVKITDAVRNAKDIDELQRLYMSDPDAFADAYVEITGKELGRNNTVDDIESLYVTLHPDQELSGVTDEEVAAAEEAPMTAEDEAEETVGGEQEHAKKLKLAYSNADEIIRRANKADAVDETAINDLMRFCYKNGIDASEIVSDDGQSLIGIQIEDATYRMKTKEEASPAPAEVKGAVKVSPEAPAATVATESVGESSEAALVSEKGKVTTKANAGPKTAADGTTLNNVVEKITNKEITSDKQLTKYFGRKGEIGSWAALAKALGVEVEQGADAHRAVTRYLKEQNAPAEAAAKPKAKDANTPEDYAKQIVSAYLDGNAWSAEQFARIIDPNFSENSFVVDPVLDKFDIEEDPDVARLLSDVLRDRGIEILNKNGADLVANYDKLNGKARAIVRDEIVKKVSEYRQAVREQRDVRGLALSNEEINQTIEGGTQNVSAGQGLQSGRVLSGGEAEVRERYQQNASGPDVSEGNESFAAWKQYNDFYEKDGAVRAGYEDLTPEYQKSVDELLDSGVPFVTVYDVSNSKNPGNLCGFVDAEHPDMGVVLFVNNPNAKSNAVTPGIVVLHEPVHYFAAKARKGGTSVDFESAVYFVAESVDAENADDVWDNLVDREIRFSGRAVLGKYEISFTDAEWKAFREMPLRQKVSELQAKVTSVYQAPDVQNFIYNKIFDEVYEELVANLAAKNPALHYAADTEVVSRAARDYLYNNGIVPRGFFERMDGPASKLKSSAGTTKASLSTQLGRSQKGLELSSEMEELQDLSKESTPQEKADARIQGLLEEFPELQQKYGSQAVSEPGQNLANALKDTPGNRIESMYVMSDGEENGIRTNTPVSEKILPEERAKSGEVKYKKTSLKSIGEDAHETIQKVLSDKTLGFNELTKHLLSKRPGALTTLEQQMVNELYARVQTQRHNLLHRKGTVHDSLLPTDAKTLWQMEKRLREVSSESAGEGARKVTQQRFSMTPEQEVWNNLSHTYLGGADPVAEDSDSVEAKMYDLGATMLDGIADVDARREAGEIDEKTAVSEMLTMVREINKVRDVARTFGPAGQIMSKWEQACLNRIANKGGEDAYDTLRMIALGSVNRINSDFDAVGLTNTIKQIRYLNLLSNPATKVSNIINNFESSINGAIGQNIAVKIQGERAKKIMGGDTPLTMNQNWHRGLIGKTNKALNEYMLTKGAESVLALYYGLDVDEGVIDIDLGAKHNQNSNAASRLLATFQFLSGLGMTTTDAMAIARAYRGMEMEIDKMGISNARKQQMKADAMMEARRQMYHADSKASKAMENLRDVLNGVTILGNKETGAIGLGDITMPFVQVPTNVALRAMRATPLGVTYGIAKYMQGMNRLQARRETYDRVQELVKRKEAKAALNAEEMRFLRENQNVSEPTDAEVRKLMRGLGESATNASATVLAAVATMMGALRDFDDEDDEAMKRLAQERGFTGLQLNLSNLMRLGRGGWKKDDLVIGGSWMEVLAIPMVAGQHIVKNWWEEDRTAGGLTSAVIESPLTTFQTFVDAAQEIPGIAQIADIWDAYENLQNYSVDKQKDRFVAGLSQYASNAASTFVIPNAVAQFAAGMDNKHRDVYRADTNWEIAANIWKNKLPGNFFGIGRETLPESFSSLGESRPYGKSKAAGLVNRMLLPGTGAQRWLPSKLEEKYQEFADAGLKVESVAPAKSPPSKITSLDGKEYTPNAEEARYYDETYTEDAVRLEYGLMNNPEFQNMTLDQQYEAMNKLRQFEDHIAKTEFLLSRGDDSGVQMDNWEKLYCEVDGTDVKISNYEKATQYVLAYAAARSVYSAKTHTFTGDKSTEWFLKNVYSKLDDAQRVAFDGSFPSMDKLYDGYTKAGITPEEYNRIRELNREYTDKAKEKDNDLSYSEAQRDLAVQYDEMLGGEKAKWAIENNKIWYTLPASTTTPDKLVKSGLTIKEADEWLDRKSQIVPAEGYKEASLNQIIQNIAGDTSLSADKQWRVLLTDGDISDSARNRLSEYKLAHPNATLLDAVNNVTYWYKDPYNKNSKRELRSYAEVYTKEDEEKSYPYAEKLSVKYGIAA